MLEYFKGGLVSQKLRMFFIIYRVVNLCFISIKTLLFYCHMYFANVFNNDKVNNVYYMNFDHKFVMDKSVSLFFLDLYKLLGLIDKSMGILGFEFFKFLKKLCKICCLWRVCYFFDIGGSREEFKILKDLGHSKASKGFLNFRNNYKGDFRVGYSGYIEGMMYKKHISNSFFLN